MNNTTSIDPRALRLKRKRLEYVSLILAVLVFSGCASGIPEGFPAVKPCTVTVTDGPLAVEDVEITLIPATPRASTIFVGKTDADGKATIRTVFAGHSADGVPEGVFTVVLKKDPPMPHTKSEAEQAGMNYDQAMKYAKDMEIARNKLPKIIPPTLTQNDSPLSVTVAGSGVTLDVDVSRYKALAQK